MTLPKHLRQRWRYLGVAIESWPSADLERRGLQRALWSSARALLGDPGSATVDLSVQRFAFADGAGGAVVRTRRDAVERARAAVTAVTGVGGAPVGLRVRGVSGTIRACEERYMRRAPKAERQRDVALGGVSGRAVRRDGRLDVGDELGATTLDR